MPSIDAVHEYRVPGCSPVSRPSRATTSRPVPARAVTVTVLVGSVLQRSSAESGPTRTR